MSIDFNRFVTNRKATLPIVNHSGKYEGRLVELNVPDGWYQIELGNEIGEYKKANKLQIEKATEKLKKYRGYPMGEEVVPFNFDQFFRKGIGETFVVQFLEEEPWEIISFVEWGDGLFYSLGPNFKAPRGIIGEVKRAFEAEASLEEIKGITPELRYYFLLHSLHRDAFRAAQELERLQLAKEERRKRIREFQATFAGRLQKTIEDAGGTLIRFYKKGRDYRVVWKIAGQQITSVIHDNEQIVSLGFCASGEDKRHTLSSAIKLAQMYYDQGGTEHGGLYITRQ